MFQRTASVRWLGWSEPRVAVGEGPASALALAASLGLLGVSAPVFALVFSIVAFTVALYALHRVNGVVKQLDDQATVQATEISELAADPSGGGGAGDG